MTTSLSNPANRPPAPRDKAQASSYGTLRRAVRAPAMLLGVSALGVAALIASILRIGPALRLGPVPQSISGKIIPVTTFAQDDNDDSGDNASANKGASLEQIEKYVAVYRAMQRNHSLTVEQAATAQGLTTSAFRDLEQRISSDERSRDTARRALAAPAPSPTPAAPTPKMRR